jgi:DNA-binding phage protein
MPKTGFDKFFAGQMSKRSFAKKYASAREQIDAVDRIIRALDEVRVEHGVTKAQLARRISAKPEILRRLFTSKAPNPTLSTILRVAAALGYKMQLVPTKPLRSSPPNQRSARRKARPSKRR